VNYYNFKSYDMIIKVSSSRVFLTSS